MEYGFAIKGQKHVLIWCEKLESGHYLVINGGWAFKKIRKTGLYRYLDNDDLIAADLVWSGEVPNTHNHNYNMALEWINEQINVQ